MEEMVGNNFAFRGTRQESILSSELGGGVMRTNQIQQLIESRAVKLTGLPALQHHVVTRTLSEGKYQCHVSITKSRTKNGGGDGNGDNKSRKRLVLSANTQTNERTLVADTVLVLAFGSPSTQRQHSHGVSCHRTAACPAKTLPST